MTAHALGPGIRTGLSGLHRAGCDDDLRPRVPSHVQQAFRAYLRCGILAHGFARAYCHGPALVAPPATGAIRGTFEYVTVDVDVTTWPGVKELFNR